MSGLRELVAGDASCAGGNSLSTFSKQVTQDRSLQQDRFTHIDNGGSSSGFAFRDRPADQRAANPELAEKFFHEGPGQAHRGFEADPYELGLVARELESVHPPVAQDWAADFARQNEHGPQEFGLVDDPHAAEFERAFAEMSLQRPPPAQWEMEFQQFQHSPAALLQDHTNAEFERAFEEARRLAGWEAEFAKDQQPQDWAAEFQTAQEGLVDAGDTTEALSRTAGMLLNSVEASENPKMKSSKFMGFMKQLRDREVAIEGNKVVEQKEAYGQASDWATEFGAKLNPASWAEEFGAADTARGEQNGSDWAAQFAKKDWASEFMGQDPLSREWKEEFEARTAELGDENQIDMDRAYNEIFGGQDWAKEYDLKMKSALDGQEVDWTALEKEWERAAAGTAYRASSPRYDTYEFTPNNPFLNQTHPQPLSTHNLTESILALEAAVQQDPTSANAWYQLGIRQQENENEVAAIAALRQAVHGDPTILDAWLALAVSYTNESCRDDAYDALQNWMNNSATYEHIPRQRMESEEGVDLSRHAQVTGMFLQAAREGLGKEDGLDADVQAALGVLFNVSLEYDKAVDCFQAALAARPEDYLLWNKLGATLANSGQTSAAMDAYFHALTINPSYIRARYNLAISCIHLGQYREAAEHLLGALSVQRENIESVVARTGGKGKGREGEGEEVGGGVMGMHGVQSRSVWAALKMVVDAHCEWF
ncbi:hypothetical protein HDV00_003509 [Rhizophlyctis rosea]|nr:hypothetical protein HDV00_003509 [Rhizophlyctis rosea]